MTERKQKPGWASLGISVVIIISQVLIYHVINFSPGWRIAVFDFAFLAAALLLGVISLWEDLNEKIPGIIGLLLTITGIVHQIILLIDPYFLDNVG